MKTTALVILLLGNLTVFGQIQDSLVFKEPELKVGSFSRLPIIYSGSCLCRPDSQSKSVLDSVTSFLNRYDNIQIQIEVHTDTRGTDLSNLKLSELTVRNVIMKLTDRGIDQNRVKAKPLGESQPWTVTEENSKKYSFLSVGTKLTDDYLSTLPEEQRDICHSLNRRTILRIIEIKN